ncbi:MAG: hypothetical protein HY653_08700, partial [Acidobacteria bacterium]|nr:hypothetical protein [Acidobacteriota bacterium]
LETFRKGKAPAAIKRAASRGTMPVAADELLEILVLLTRDPDPTCSETAQQTLATWSMEKCAQVLAAPHIAAETLEYFAAQPVLTDGIALVIAAHPKASDGALAALAPRLSLQQLEPLLQSQERLTSLPLFAAAVLGRSDLPDELRQRLEAVSGEAPDQTEDTAAALVAAVEGDETEAEKKLDKRERVSLLHKLSRMSVPERVQQALKGSKEERMILVRDPAKVVYRAVLESPKLSESDVESIATMKNVSEEVLRIIANSRQFMKSYIVVRNLINNPRTPLDISLPLINHLTNQDLKFLTLNRNVPETLRAMATKLHKQRAAQRQGGS